MKILLVIDQFFAANNGMTISARRFAQVLEQHGHEVLVASTGSEGDTEFLMKKQYIPVFDKLVTSQGMVFAKPNDELLRRAIERVDVVHLLVPFVLSKHAMNIAAELGVPCTSAFHVQPENVTSSIHLSHAKLVNDAIYAWFRHYIYQYCRHVHCPSRFIANELRNHGYMSELHVISNGIDPDFVYRKMPKTADLEGKFVILSVGRLSIEKRQDVTIKAIAQSKYRDNIVLMLAGQGPRKEKLRRLAERCGIDVRMQFYDKKGLLDIIAMSDLYVHAADAEIEAMSAMEAFSGGLLPIIANSSRSATPQFALDERSLFEVGNTQALAERIDYWIEHEDERRVMERRYSDLGTSYQLDACVRKAEDMFRLAILENEAAKKAAVCEEATEEYGARL